MACGNNRSFIISNKGTVFTFISCGSGRLVRRPIPTEFSFADSDGNALNGVKIVKVACGYWNAIALSDKHKVFTFGDNQRFQLGLAAARDDVFTLVSLNSPPNNVELDSENAVIDVYCSKFATFLLMRNGDVYSCGWNLQGETGH